MKCQNSEEFVYFDSTPPQHRHLDDTATFDQTIQQVGRACGDVLPLIKSADGTTQAIFVIRQGYLSGPWLCGQGIDWHNFLPGPKAYARHVLRSDLQLDVPNDVPVRMLSNRFLYSNERPIPELLMWQVCHLGQVSTDSIKPSTKYAGYRLASTWSQVDSLLREHGRHNTIQQQILFDLWDELVQLDMVSAK